MKQNNGKAKILRLYREFDLSIQDIKNLTDFKLEDIKEAVKDEHKSKRFVEKFTK